MTHLHWHLKNNNFRTITKISITRLILAIAIAIYETIWILYFNEFDISESIIGYITSFLITISLITSIYLPKILERNNLYKLFLLSLLILFLSFISIPLLKNLFYYIFILIIITIFSILRISTFTILFKKEEDNPQKFNEDEGLLYTLLNVGWFVGPLIAGFILESFGINYAFISSGLFVLISLIIFIMLKKEILINLEKSNPKNEKKEKIKIFSNIKSYFSNKEITLAYIMSLGLEIWWALIYIYIPLFMLKEGVDSKYIPLFLSIIIIPLIIFEFKVGKISETKGFKLFFFTGFLLLSIISLINFFIYFNIFYVLILLIIASIPASFIEPLQETFFLKSISYEESNKYYPIFTTAMYIGSFIGKFSIATLLLFLPNKYAYLIMSLMMLIISLISLKIKK
jgi:predicted MFS family arabinose efflux permease